jgi:hypothetical protein
VLVNQHGNHKVSCSTHLIESQCTCFQAALHCTAQIELCLADQFEVENDETCKAGWCDVQMELSGKRASSMYWHSSS